MNKMKRFIANSLIVRPQNSNTGNKIAHDSIKYGIMSLIFFALIFMIWAIFIPIKSASIADGIIVLDFNRKNIQHFEGGIVDKILVKEGQIVKEGDILLYLQDIRAKSEQQILKERLWTNQIQRSRLVSERENNSALNLNNFLLQTQDLSAEDKLKLQEIIKTQSRLHKARMDKRRGEIKVLYQKLKSAKTRLNLFEKELSLIQPLVQEDNLPILREIDLQKSIAQTQEEVETADLQIANYKNNDLSEILKEIKESDLEIVSLYNQLVASKDVIKRTAIKSPVAGKVMNIKYHTIGAVIPPGGDLMTIVPQNEELIIEAKIIPQDIDNVSIGMKSKIQLTAYKGKKVPKINGEVINISPDILINENSSESFFLARVSIDQRDISKLKNKVELYPGMPAQVFIINDSRSLIGYLFSPIYESFYKAFREE